MLTPWKESYDQPRQHIKKQRHYFANKGPCSQRDGMDVWMWKLDQKERWIPKNWCFWTVVLEKTLESSCTARRSNQSILKEISPGISLEEMMLKLKLQYFWPPHVKSWLIGKDPDAGRDWGQEEKGMTEDEMAGWHHRLNAHEFGWTRIWWWTARPGVLRFMWSQRVGHDWTTELNWAERQYLFFLVLTWVLLDFHSQLSGRHKT